MYMPLRSSVRTCHKHAHKKKHGQARHAGASCLTCTTPPAEKMQNILIECHTSSEQLRLHRCEISPSSSAKVLLGGEDIYNPGTLPTVWRAADTHHSDVGMPLYRAKRRAR